MYSYLSFGDINMYLNFLSDEVDYIDRTISCQWDNGLVQHICQEKKTAEKILILFGSNDVINVFLYFYNISKQ